MNSRDNMRNGIFSAQGSKDSAVLFVAGDNKMKDHTNRTNTIRRVHKMFMALLIALTMMISSAVPGVSAFAANNNDTVRVATYDQLQEALEETKGVKEIVVDPQAAVDEGEVVYSVEGDENNNAFYIGFDEALTVSDDITITSADDVDVYFARSDSFRNDQDKPALLNIEAEGNLNLDGLITMSGEEVATTFYEANEVNPAEFVFSVKSKDGTGEDNEVWNSKQALKGGFYIQNNGGEYTLGDDVVMKDINLADDVEDAEQIHEEEKTTSADEEEVVEESADAAESTDSEEVAGVWEEKEEEATEEAPVVSAPKRSLMSMRSPALMSSTPAQTKSGQSDATPVDPTGTKTVATFEQLKAALEAASINTIIIDKTGYLLSTNNKDENGKKQEPTINGDGKFYLPIDEPLTVNRKVEIKTKDADSEVIIARSNNFKAIDAPALFNVTSGGDLTLSSKITMTGDQVTATYNEGQNYVAATTAPVEMTNDTGNLYLGASQSTASNFDLKVYNSATGYRFEIGDDGRLLCYKKNSTTPEYIKCDSLYTLRLTMASNGDIDLRVRNLSGNNIEKLEANQTYVLYNTNYKCYLKNDNGSLLKADNIDAATKFKAGGSSSSGSSGSTTEGKAYIPPSFKFDVTPTVWKQTEIKEGGYFIHATNGGKVTLNSGVSLQGLNTAADVKDAAPVVVSGGSTFKMTGGSITGNTIGYGPSEPTQFNENLSDGPVVARGAGYAETGGIRKAIQKADMTNTAGGIIFKGSGTTATITGGSINGNKADAGGIIVTDNAVVDFGKKDDSTKNPGIDGNIGWHHAGAAQVENGGLLNMYGGHMNNNVAWYKGGAVVVTEFGTGGYVNLVNGSPTNRRSAGKFLMDGGTLDRNYAFVRGGAIEVESNSVVLKNGTISNNKCKSLGGAIYVEGDYADYSYTLVINQGYIHNNTAVGAVPDKGDDGVDKKLVNGVLTNSTSDYDKNGDGKHKDADFPNKHSGNGGGVWLCPLGGTSVFTSNGAQKVVINNNTAHSAKKTRWNLGWGDDFYLSTGKGAALLQNLEGEWKYDRQPNPEEGEKLGEIGADGKVLNGPVGLYNSSKNLVGSGIVITGNRSRDGGGIAANGTVVLGVAKDVYRFNSEIEIEKKWIGSNGEEVKIELLYEDANGNKKPLVSVDTQQEYSIDLNDSTNVNKPEDAVIYRTGAWKAKALIPAFIYEKDNNGNIVGDPIHLYRVKKPGEGNNFFDLTTTKGIKEFHDYIGTNGSKDLTVEWNIFLKETVQSADGETKYTIEREVKSSVGKTEKRPVHLGSPVIGENGQVVNGFDIYFTTVQIKEEIENSLKETNVTLTKTGLGGAKLNNAEFALYKAVVREGGDIYAENGANTNSTEKVKPYKKGIKSSGSGDNAGKITIDAVGPGAYLLFETKAPEGYYLPKSPWFMFVGKDGKVTVTRLSDANQGKITNSDNAPYDVSGNTEAERLDNLNAWLKKKWWKREWFNITADSYNLSADNVAKIGNIKFVTDPSNDNYQGVTVTDANGKSELQNKPVELKLYKYEGSFDGTTAKVDTSKPLANAKFKIYKASNSNDKKYLKGDKVGAAEEVLTSNADGSIILPDEVMLNGGDYWLEEVSASPGYVKPNTPWVIWVKEGIIQQIHYFKNYTGNNELIWANNKQTQSTLIAQSGKAAYIHNEPYMLTKVDAANREGLKDAEFVICEIWQDGSGDFRLKGTDVVQWGPTNPPKDTEATYLTRALKDNDNNTIVLKSDKDGKMRLPTTLEAGHRYFLFEKTAPEGYVRSKSPWLIEVEEDYDISVLAVDKSKEGKVKDGNSPTDFEGNVYNKYWPSSWYYQNGIDWKYSGGEEKFVSGTPVNNSNLELINVKVYELPKAGGMGTYWFMIIGMMMMAFAATMALTKKSAVRR